MTNIDHWPDACWNAVAESMTPWDTDNARAIEEHRAKCEHDHA